MSAAAGARKPRVTPSVLKSEIDAVMAPIADVVAKLHEPYLRALAPVLEQAEREAGDALAHWLATHAADGDARFTAHQLRLAQLQLRKALVFAEKRIPAVFGPTPIGSTFQPTLEAEAVSPLLTTV